MTCILRRSCRKAQGPLGLEFMLSSAGTNSFYDLTFPLNKINRLGEVQWLQAGKCVARP